MTAKHPKLWTGSSGIQPSLLSAVGVSLLLLWVGVLPMQASGGFDIGAVERQGNESTLTPHLYLPLILTRSG